MQDIWGAMFWVGRRNDGGKGFGCGMLMSCFLTELHVLMRILSSLHRVQPDNTPLCSHQLMCPTHRYFVCSVYVYVCMYVCTCMYVCVYICMYACKCTMYVCACMYVFTRDKYMYLLYLCIRHAVPSPMYM